MFPLSNGRLIRVNKDGSDGEIISSKNTSMVFGTSVLNDYYIHDADPKLNIHCEIATDEYGRVSITNKSSNEILVNDKPITSMRPLFNNSIIKVCNGIQFRWQYKHAKENIGTDLNEADFASWSDPAKKNNKQSRLTKKEKQKGRLTAHPLHIFSQKNMESESLNSLNESVSTATNSTDIDGEPVVQSDTNIIQSEVTKIAEMQKATVSVAETEISIVKSQLSNCSIITVSSDGGHDDDTVETANESKDVSIEIFDHTILPSSQESQNAVSKCDPNIEISLLATPVTSADKRVASTICDFNTTNLIDFDSTMNITNTKDENNSASLTPCSSASIIPEKNDERIEAMINTESLFEDSDLIEIDDDKENSPIVSTEADNDASIEIVLHADEDEATNGDQEHPEEISSSPISIENDSESQEKVQLEIESNEIDTIQIPLIPASELDTSAEFAKVLNCSNADNVVQKVEDDYIEHDGDNGISESPVINDTTENDESFIRETQLETSIDFELSDSSVDNKDTEPKTHTESLSQIENENSIISDAIESNDLMSVCEKQADTYEKQEIVEQEIVPIELTVVEIDTAIEKDSNVEEKENKIDDQEAQQIDEIVADCEETPEFDSPLVLSDEDNGCHDDGLVPKTEGERITGALNQTEIVLTKNDGDINQDDVKVNAAIQTVEASNDTTIDNDLNVKEEKSESGDLEQSEEKSPSHSNEVIEAESSLVSTKEFAEALKLLDTDNLAQDVGEQSFIHDDANQSVIESAATNKTSEEDESFIPETQFDTTNDFDMKSNDSTSLTNETSDQMEIEGTASEDFDSVIVYEKQAGTFEDVEQENVSIEKDSNKKSDHETSHILSEDVSEVQQTIKIEAECEETAETTEKDESFILETQCGTTIDINMESNNLECEKAELNVLLIDDEKSDVIECVDAITMPSTPTTEDETIAEIITQMDSVDVTIESVMADEEKIQSDAVRIENEEIFTEEAADESLSLSVIANDDIVNNSFVIDSTVPKSEETNAEISNVIEFEQPISESIAVVEIQDDTSEECEMINNSQTEEFLVENNENDNESLKNTETNVAIAIVSEIAPESNGEAVSFAVDSDITSSANEIMDCEQLDNETQNKLQDSFLDTSSHYTKTESSAVSSMFNDSVPMTEDETCNDTSKESGLERTDDEFDLPISSEKDTAKTVDEKFTQINKSIKELKQNIQQELAHSASNSLIDDEVSDLQKHIEPTEMIGNVDVEIKSESENISIDVKDFDLRSTSENDSTQSDASVGDVVFDLDHFLNSQQATILEPSTKPEMSTADTENVLNATPSNTQTASDSESYNLCDFSIESEPSLIAQDFTPTFVASNESPIKLESESFSGTEDQIYDAKDQSKQDVKDCIEEDSKPDSEVSANDKTTENLMKLISDVYIENKNENITDIPNSTSENLVASESIETSACETVIEVKNLELAIESTKKSILSLEVKASIVSNGHSTETAEDHKHLVSNDAIIADQKPTEVELIAATISEIGQSTSILDNVDGKDNKSDLDRLIKSDVSNPVGEKLEISTDDDIKSNEQVVVEPIGDVIKMENDITNTRTAHDIVGFKNVAIECDHESSASSDHMNLSTSDQMKRSISEATTVSRTISDDLEIKVELTPVKVSKPSSTVIDESFEGTSTKAYDHQAINTPLVDTDFCYLESLSSISKGTDFEQLIDQSMVGKFSTPKNDRYEQKQIAEETKTAPCTPLVNKNLKNVEKKPSPRRTRSASKSSKSNENGANLDLDSIKKDIVKVAVTDIQKPMKTPASKLSDNSEPRSSSKRNVKSVSTRKPDSEMEIPNSSSTNIQETPKKRSTEKPEPEEAPQTPLVNKHLQIGGTRSSARRNVRPTYTTKDSEEKELNKASVSKTDTPKNNLSEQTESEVAQTPVADKSSVVVEPRSSTRRNMRTAFITKKDEQSEFGNKSSAAIVDTPKVRQSEKAEPEVAPQTPVADKIAQVVEPRSSTRRNVRYATKEAQEKEINNKTNATTIDTPKVHSSEKAEPELAPETPLINKHLQIGGLRSSTRRNVRSTCTTKESDEMEIDSTIDTPKMSSSQQTESELAPQTPGANKSLVVVEPRSSARRNIRSAYATKSNDEKELNNKAIPTPIDTPKIQSNDNTETSVKRSARINKRDNSFAMTVDDVNTQFETPKKRSDAKTTTVREPVTFEPEALSTPVLKSLQDSEAKSSAKRDAFGNCSTPHADITKSSTKTTDIDFGTPATPLVNKNLRLIGTRSSAKRGRTAHDDVIGSASKSLKLDTSELKTDVTAAGTDPITEQMTPVINKSIRVIEPRSSARRNVKSIYATKVIEPSSTSNTDLSCTEKETNILKTTASKLNETATLAINQSKNNTVIESNPMTSLSEMLKTPVVKKTLRKNAAKQKATNKLAETCVTEPKVDTIIGNVGVDDSMNNSLGLKEMLKTPAAKTAYGPIDSQNSARNAKLNAKNTIQAMKNESELSSPEKISEILKSPVAYTSSLILSPGSSTNNSKMVKLANIAPNKKPIQMASNVISTPSTSGISPNNKTQSTIRISGLKSINVVKRIVPAQTPQSSNKNIGQSPMKSQMPPLIKSQTPIQLGNTSSSSFVPFVRPTHSSFVKQSPAKSSNSFSSTGTPNNALEMNNMLKYGKTYSETASGTPNPATHKSFVNQSPAKTSNASNLSFEPSMFVKTPVKSLTERKSFTGADGLYYRSPINESSISPMKQTVSRPSLTPNASLLLNSISPKIQIARKSTPKTTPTMNKMQPIQYSSQSTSSRCRQMDFGCIGTQLEKHQNQTASFTPNTSQANSAYMKTSTPQLSTQLVPSRVAQGYMNPSPVSMQKGTMMNTPTVLNTQLMPQSSSSYNPYQFLQVVNTSSVQQNVGARLSITKQSPSIANVSNVTNKQAFDYQSPAMQSTATAQTQRPGKRRMKQIDSPIESANEMPVQRAIETVTNNRAKRAKTASFDMLPDQTSFIPIGQSTEMNMNSVSIQPKIDEKPKRGRRKASKDEKPAEAEKMKLAPIGQSINMHTNSVAVAPLVDEKPKRGKRKVSKDEDLTEADEVKPKRGRQKKNEKIESSNTVAMVKELLPIVEEQVKPKRGGRRQNSATETVISEPSSSVEMSQHLQKVSQEPVKAKRGGRRQNSATEKVNSEPSSSVEMTPQEVSQEPVKAKRGGRRQNSATETINVEPTQEMIDVIPGRRNLRKKTTDEAPPAPELAKPTEMAKTTRSKRNVVEPIIEEEEKVAEEKSKRGRRKAVQIELPAVPEYTESTVEVKTTRSKRRPTVDEDMSSAQSSNVKNGNQKKVQFEYEMTQDKMSAHETSIELAIEPIIEPVKKMTRKRTQKSKVEESDDETYEAPRTRRGRKPKTEAVQETAEETKVAVTRPRRAAKKP